MGSVESRVHSTEWDIRQIGFDLHKIIEEYMKFKSETVIEVKKLRHQIKELEDRVKQLESL